LAELVWFAVNSYIIHIQRIYRFSFGTLATLKFANKLTWESGKASMCMVLNLERRVESEQGCVRLCEIIIKNRNKNIFYTCNIFFKIYYL